MTAELQAELEDLNQKRYALSVQRNAASKKRKALSKGFAPNAKAAPAKLAEAELELDAIFFAAAELDAKVEAVKQQIESAPDEEEE